MAQTSEQDREMLTLTLELARESGRCGSRPVGCAVVDEGGKVIAEGRDRSGEPWPLASRELAASPLAHAALVALFHLPEFAGAESWTLYLSKEPCLMCVGAIQRAGVGRVVWARDDPEGGAGRQLGRVEVKAQPFAELAEEAAALEPPSG